MAVPEPKLINTRHESIKQSNQTHLIGWLVFGSNLYQILENGKRPSLEKDQSVLEI